MSSPTLKGSASKRTKQDAASGDLASAARGGSLGLVGAAVSAISGFALTVTVSRALGSDGTGVFFSMVALFMIAAATTTFGADTGLVRQLSRLVALGRLHDLRRTVVVGLAPAIVLALATSAVLLLAADPVLDRVLRQAGTGRVQARGSYVWFVGLLAVGVAFGVVVQATRGLGSIRYFVGLQNVFVPAVRPLLVLLAVGLGSAAWLPAAAWTLPLIPALALAGLALARLLRKAGARADATTPAPLGWRALAREFWSFSVWRGLSSVLEITMLWLDVLLVAALVGVGEAGIYAAASRFATTGTLVLQAMRLAIAPQLSALLATGKTDRAGQVYRTATTWIIAASWPLYLLMAFFSAPVLSIFGSTFSDGATALTILAVAMMFNLATGNVTTVLLMAGRSSWMLFDKSVALVVMVGLDLLLVPAYGVTGAAIGWGASIAVDKGLAVWQVSTKLGLRGGDAGTLLASGASLAWYGGVAAVCTALGLDGWTGLAATLVVAGAGYAPTVWLLRERLHLRPLIDLVIGRSSSTSGGERG